MGTYIPVTSRKIAPWSRLPDPFQVTTGKLALVCGNVAASAGFYGPECLDEFQSRFNPFDLLIGHLCRAEPVGSIPVRVCAGITSCHATPPTSTVFNPAAFYRGGNLD